MWSELTLTEDAMPAFSLCKKEDRRISNLEYWIPSSSLKTSRRKFDILAKWLHRHDGQRFRSRDPESRFDLWDNTVPRQDIDFLPPGWEEVILITTVQKFILIPELNWLNSFCTLCEDMSSFKISLESRKFKVDSWTVWENTIVYLSTWRHSYFIAMKDTHQNVVGRFTVYWLLRLSDTWPSWSLYWPNGIAQ